MYHTILCQMLCLLWCTFNPLLPIMLVNMCQMLFVCFVMELQSIASMLAMCQPIQPLHKHASTQEARATQPRDCYSLIPEWYFYMHTCHCLALLMFSFMSWIGGDEDKQCSFYVFNCSLCFTSMLEPQTTLAWGCLDLSVCACFKHAKPSQNTLASTCITLLCQLLFVWVCWGKWDWQGKFGKQPRVIRVMQLQLHQPCMLTSQTKLHKKPGPIAPAMHAGPHLNKARATQPRDQIPVPGMHASQHLNQASTRSQGHTTQGFLLMPTCIHFSHKSTLGDERQAMLIT